MKILESQNAVLSNFEVYQHLLNEQYKFKQPDRKRKVPRTAQTIIKEVRLLLPPSLFHPLLYGVYCTFFHTRC